MTTDVQVRALGMLAERGHDTARAEVPPGAGLEGLARAAAACTACPLHEDATQTVFGEGPRRAMLMVVGEQPGDREDVRGQPFVGPAGGELDRGLEAAGIGRDEVYVTNTVKHFKFSRRGKRRIHERPTNHEIDACLPWLQSEIAEVRPDAVLTLGATASKALIGPSFRVTRQRGELFAGVAGSIVTGTVHPSSILRAGDGDARAGARAAFHDDLRLVASLLQDGTAAALQQRTRDDLYEFARRLDLAGRSSMSKSQLAAAVADVIERAASRTSQPDAA